MARKTPQTPEEAKKRAQEAQQRVLERNKRKGLLGRLLKRNRTQITPQPDKQSDAKTRLEEAKKRIEEAEKRTEEAGKYREEIETVMQDNTEEVPECSKIMDEAWEKYEPQMNVLEMIYGVLRNHITHDEAVDKNKPFNASNLLEYFGFNEENLTNVLRAVFGDNPNNIELTPEEMTDPGFKIRGKLKSDGIINVDDFILRVMFGLNANSPTKTIKENIKAMGKRLTIPSVMNFPVKRMEKIKQVLVTIKQREAENNDELDVEEQINVAAIEFRMGPKQDNVDFNNDLLEQKITEHQNTLRGNRSNNQQAPQGQPQRPQQHQGQPQQGQQSQRPQRQPRQQAPQGQPQGQRQQAPRRAPRQATVQHNINFNELLTEDFEVMVAVTALLTKLKGMNEDQRNKFADKVNNLPEYRGIMFGMDLAGLHNDLRPKKALEVIADRLNATNAQSLKKKVIELDNILRIKVYQ